jgi:hypothetical protein
MKNPRGQEPVRLLVKDQSSVEEAVRTSVAIFQIMLNINNLFLVLHAKGKDTKDLTTLF